MYSLPKNVYRERIDYSKIKTTVPIPKTKPRSRKATTGPAARSRAAIGAGRMPRVPTAPIPAHTMRKSTPRNYATRMNSPVCVSSWINSCSICKV